MGKLSIDAALENAQESNLYLKSAFDHATFSILCHIYVGNILS